MATFLVTTLENAGPGSLRAAIDGANAADGMDVITFEATLAGGTIDLASALRITEGGLQIDGDLDDDGTPDITLDGGFQSRILEIDGDDAVILEGLVMSGGRVPLGDSPSGGAVLATGDGALTVRASVIEDSSAGDSGGAIRASGALEISDSLLVGNSAQRGGALSASDTVRVLNSELRNNVADNVGGAIDAPTAIVEDSVLVANRALLDEGGAVYGFNLISRRSEFAANEAGGAGGAFWIIGDVTLEDSLFVANAASDEAGAGAVREGAANVRNSTFIRNTAEEDGGALYLLDLADSNGGATIVHSTFNGNIAGVSGISAVGGAIALRGGLGNTVANSILIGNAASTSAETDDEIFVEFTDLTFLASNIVGNDVLDGGTVVASTSVGQVFGDLASDGTVLLDSNVGPVPIAALRVAIDNPALDGGDEGALAAAAGLTFDKRGDGFARVVDGDGDGVDEADLGAFEINDSPPEPLGLVVTTLADGLDPFDGETTLREAINWAARAAGADVITVDPGLAGGTIELTEGPLVIRDGDGLTIDLGVAGALFGLTVDGLGNDRLFEIDDGDTDREAVTITNAVLRGGQTSDTGAGGGAIRAEGVALTLDNVALVGNATTGFDADGGALFASESDVVVTESIVGSNRTEGQSSQGGAILVRDGTLSIESSVAENNATTGEFARGGGIFAFRTPASISDSVIQANTTAGENSGGGGIAARVDSPLSIVNTTITANTVAGVSVFEGGGVLATDRSPLTATNNIILGNVAFSFPVLTPGSRDGTVQPPTPGLRDDIALARDTTFVSGGGNLFGPGVTEAGPDDRVGVAAAAVFRFPQEVRFDANGDGIGDAPTGVIGSFAPQLAVDLANPALDGATGGGTGGALDALGNPRVAALPFGPGDLDIGGVEEQPVVGTAGPDTLTGTANPEFLLGGAGSDVIASGFGADVVFGGAATDRFVGTPGDLDGDVIADYESSETIEVEGVTFDRRAVIDTRSGGAARLAIDTDGDGASDLDITVEGVPGLGDAQLFVTPRDGVTALQFVEITVIEVSPWDGQPIGAVVAVDDLTLAPSRVDFGVVLDDPVVFATPATLNDEDPVTTRLFEVDDTGTTLALDEPNYLTDDVHAPEDLTLLALSEGVWKIADGRQLEVGTVATDLLSTEGWLDVDFSEPFETAPVVVAQIQTANGPDWIVPRLDDVTTTGFSLTLQEEEARNQGWHVEEVVGWLALEPGVFDWSGLDAEAFTTGRRIDHTADAVTFDAALATDPLVVAGLASFFGPDTANLRRADAADGTVGFLVDEEQSRDAETRHTPEEVAGIAFAEDGLLLGTDALVG